MKILKKKGVVEKRGGGNEIHAPCACEKNTLAGMGPSWVQKKKSETVFSQYKIMLHLEKNIYTLARQKCCARI